MTTVQCMYFDDEVMTAFGGGGGGARGGSKSNCATADCAAGLSPTKSDNRSYDQAQRSLDRLTANVSTSIGCVGTLPAGVKAYRTCTVATKAAVAAGYGRNNRR